MNTKTLEAITRHGIALLNAFPHAPERDPVKLCKKLRRIETAIARVVMDYSNGENGVNQDRLDHEKALAKIRVSELLGLDKYGFELAGLLVNSDPRGYALKIDDEKSGWFVHWQDEQRKAGKPTIHTDWGGFGILAPDLTEAQ